MEAAEKLYNFLIKKIGKLEKKIEKKRDEIMVLEEKIYRYERDKAEEEFDLDEYLGGGKESADDWFEH